MEYVPLTFCGWKFQKCGILIKTEKAMKANIPQNVRVLLYQSLTLVGNCIMMNLFSVTPTTSHMLATKNMKNKGNPNQEKKEA